MIDTKKAFTDPTFEIVKLLVEDVVTTSGEDDGWWLPEIPNL